jgi:hypothetical protein
MGWTIDVIEGMPDYLDESGLLVTVGAARDPVHRAAAFAANVAGKANTSLRFEREGFEIGPLNYPGWCACLECYLQRLVPDALLSSARDSLVGTLHSAELVPTFEFPLVRLGIAALLTQIDPDPMSAPTLARVHHCSLRELSWEHYWVHQVPGCPLCHIGFTKLLHGNVG